MKRIDFNKTSVEKGEVVVICPQCGSVHFTKYGFYDGKQRYLCKECKIKFTQPMGWIHPYRKQL